MLRKTEGGFFALESFAKQKGLLHGFSTRTFGNMSFRQGGGDVRKDRLKFAEAVGFDPRRVVTMGLAHGTKVAVVGEENLVNLGDDQYSFLKTDGLLTNEPGIFLFLLIADCLPILFFAPKAKVVGLAHAGREGSLKKIAARVVEKMVRNFQVRTKDILVGIGPSVGPCCYNMDLWSLNKQALLGSGIAKENIEFGGLCTSCHHEDFFSNRKASRSGRAEKEGRFAAVVGIKR